MATIVRYEIVADGSDAKRTINELRDAFTESDGASQGLQDALSQLEIELQRTGTQTTQTSNLIDSLKDAIDNTSQGFIDFEGENNSVVSGLSELQQSLSQSNVGMGDVVSSSSLLKNSFSEVGGSVSELKVDVSNLYDETETLIITQTALNSSFENSSASSEQLKNSLEQLNSAKRDNSSLTEQLNQQTSRSANENQRLIPIIQQNNSDFNRRNQLLRASTASSSGLVGANVALASSSAAASSAIASQGASSANTAKSVGELKTQFSGLLKTQVESEQYLANLNNVLGNLRTRANQAGVSNAELSFAMHSVIDALGKLMGEGMPVVDAFAKLREEFKDNEVAVNAVGEAYGHYEDRLVKVTPKQKKLTEILNEGALAHKALQEATKQSNEELNKSKESSFAAGKGFESIDKFINFLPSSFASATKSIVGFGKQLWALVKNPVGIVLLGIAGALKFLHDVVSPLQFVMDAFANVGLRISTTYQALVGMFQGLRSPLAFFNGQVKQARESLQDLRIEIRELNETLNLRTAQFNRALQESLRIINDTTFSLEQRNEAIDNARNLQNQILDLEEEILVAKIRQMAIQNSLNRTNSEGQKEYNDLVAEFIDLQARRDSNERQLQRYAQRTQREQEAANESAQTFLQSLEDSLKTQDQLAIQNFERQRDRLWELFEGELINQQQKINGLAQIDQLEREYVEARQKEADELEASKQAALAQEKAIIEGNIQQIRESFKTQEELEREALSNRLQAQKDFLNEALQANVISEIEKNELLSAINAQYLIDKAELDRLYRTEENEEIIDNIVNREAAIAELRSQFANEADAERREELAKTIQIKQEELENFRLTEAQKTAIARAESMARLQMNLRVFSLISQGLGELFENSKAVSLIQAGINTAEAVTKALPNIPLAIATGALGAIQIGKIASAKPPQRLASGGWVSGGGTETSDSIPAMLSNNEFVVNAQSARQFGGLLETMNDRPNDFTQAVSQFTKAANNLTARVDLTELTLAVNRRNKDIGETIYE